MHDRGRNRARQLEFRRGETMSRNILVIAAHPDDEVLGCGGCIARHVDAGDRVSVAILAQGVTSRGGTEVASAIADLRDQARRANQLLGVSALEFLDFPDNQMDSVTRLSVIQSVEALIERIRPSVIYTHWAGDVNIDHRIIHDAVICACRPQPGHPVESLLFFEVASSTEWQPPYSATPFVPNWFVDISQSLERKLAAMAAYSSELRLWPHPRSLDALTSQARWRGSSVGCEAAEAFVLGRHRVTPGSLL